MAVLSVSGMNMKFESSNGIIVKYNGNDDVRITVPPEYWYKVSKYNTKNVTKVYN